jgi:hypothetical protein
MTHPNAPLNIEGRRRLVTRCQTRPISHVAAAPEMGISRSFASKWLQLVQRSLAASSGVPGHSSSSPRSAKTVTIRSRTPAASAALTRTPSMVWLSLPPLMPARSTS